MSDNLPFEIQIEIIRRLPVTSLIQFRSVSKAWKFLIDSSDFIADYTGQVQHLFVSYEDSVDSKVKFVLVSDDDTFPQQRVSLTPPLLVKNLKSCSIVGSSHGLLCLSGVSFFGTQLAVFWNLSIRKAVGVVVPNVGNDIYTSSLGFGVCRETTDPKIVKIRYITSRSDLKRIICIPSQVEVFTLSTGVWRNPYSSSNLPRKSIEFNYSEVVVGGCLYWSATDRITLNGELTRYKLIISFDMTSEEFREMNLQDRIPHRSKGSSLCLSKLRESLVVYEHVVEANNIVNNVWMLEDGVANSFKKLYTFNVNTPFDDASLMGFRKSGEPIIQIQGDEKRWIYKLVVYELYSKHMYNLGINGAQCSFVVHPYKETLLLLDHPNLKVFNKMEPRDDLVSRNFVYGYSLF